MDEKKECPIDQTQLTAFNQYELQNDTICRDCAKKIGLLDGDHNNQIAKAAKALLTVSVATDYINDNKSLDPDELLQAYADEFSEPSSKQSVDESESHDDTVETSPSSEQAQAEPVIEQTDKTSLSETNKKSPIFWKGDGVSGFLYGAAFGFAIGFINIGFLHIPWLGRIVFIACWLIIGHSKSLSERSDKFLSSGDNPYDLNKHPAVSKEPKIKKQKVKKQIVYTEPKAPKPAKPSRKAPHCPKCKSTNIQILDNKRKFSIGKTVVGGVAFNVAGAAVGAFAGKHGKKYHAVCMQCGKKFLVKL